MLRSPGLNRLTGQRVLEIEGGQWRRDSPGIAGETSPRKLGTGFRRRLPRWPQRRSFCSCDWACWKSSISSVLTWASLAFRLSPFLIVQRERERELRGLGFDEKGARSCIYKWGRRRWAHLRYCFFIKLGHRYSIQRDILRQNQLLTGWRLPSG